jgi:hypothetical protein
LATHDGLFDVSRSPAEQAGPSIDLMGTSTDGTLYASGHPGPGTDLPDPVGLITSTDQGNTWTPVARQGETDFHALAVAGTDLVGYEGRILTSTEGHHWTVPAEDIPAHSLAGALDGEHAVIVIAIAVVRDDDGTTGIWVATADGVQVPRDDGATFAPLRAS